MTITYMKGDGTTDSQTRSPLPKNSRVHGDGQGQAGDGRRRRPRLLGQGGVHQRAGDHRRAPHVLQLQRGHGPAGTTWWGPPHRPPPSTSPRAPAAPTSTPTSAYRTREAPTPTVTITYMKGDGTTDTQTRSPCPRTPASTVTVKDKLGRGRRRRPRLLRQGGVHQRAAHHRRAPHVLQLQRAYWTGGHDVVGATSPSATFYFAEGTCRPGLRPLLLHTEPGKRRRRRDDHLHEGRRHHRPQTRSPCPRTPAHRHASRTSWGRATTPPTTSRPRWSAPTGSRSSPSAPCTSTTTGSWTGGHDVVGATSPSDHLLLRRGHLPAQLRPLLLHTEPGRRRRRSDDHLHEGGRHHRPQSSVTVAKNSRVTVIAQGQAGNGGRRRPRLLRQGGVHQRAAIIAERPMYFNYNGRTGPAGTTWWGSHPLPERTDYQCHWIETS